MDKRILLLACLCAISKVQAVALGVACTDNAGCETDDPNSECDTTCKCKATHVEQDGVCKAKSGQPCTGADATGCVKYTTCSTDQCTCIDGATGDECAAVYDTTCSGTNACPGLSNSKCTDSKCKCDAAGGYKHDDSMPKVCITVIESTCTADTDCSNVANTVCSNGGTRTCVCKPGYKANGDKTACEMKMIDDVCMEDTDCLVTNSECPIGAKTCTCRNGYSVSWTNGVSECTGVYDKPCTSGGTECDDLKHSECSEDKCKCLSTAVVEDSVCKLKIGQTCDDEAICPNDSSCIEGKCKCSDNFDETDDGKCAAKNGKTVMAASLIVMVLAAFASILL